MEPCPAVALPSSFDDFLARLPTKRRTDVRRHLRRLDDGELRLCPVTADTEIPAAIERWRRLRERQWAAMERDLDPLHATAPFGAFVVDAVRGLMAAGHAVVWEFRRDGEDEVVGSVINLVDDRTVYGWLGGYAPSAARLGVGKIAIAEGIRSSIAAGRTEFSLLLGPEPYKYFWHPVDGQSPDFLVHSRRPRSLLALGAARVGGRLA
jgi:CelD/BcsL family acetyltransferase involved in cellulose biosynthesis